MAFDFKKEYKEFYMPKSRPEIVTVPRMNYIAVRGSGDPNEEDGDYKKAIGLLYGIAFTIKIAAYYARAIPIEIPPMAISMHIRISTIRMMIFVDFFISLHPFRVEFITV